jgi:hypothetical protein
MGCLHRWRIRCNTDSKFEYEWATAEPTECPVNPAHSIGGVVVIETRCPSNVIIDPSMEAILPGASIVVANDRPAVEVQDGETGWGAIQARWPYILNSAAEIEVRIKFILKATGTGSVARIGARAKAQGVGDDSSESWADEQFSDETVTHTTIGEVFEAVLMLDAGGFDVDDAIALQIGRDGSHANDTLNQAVQIIGVKAEAH